MTIAPLFRRVTLIRFAIDGDRITGTGFFFRYGDDLYLATNRHVLEGKSGFSGEPGKSPGEIDILYWGETSRDRIRNISISVKNDNGEPRWATHENEKVDLCLLPLSDYDLGQGVINSFTKHDFYPMNPERTKVGRGTMVVGYPSPGPRAIKDSRTSDPIAVSGMISSEYGADFDHQPFFLIDADTYDGMSGSPVVIRPGPDFSITSGFTMGGDETFFLGIHSGPYEALDKLDLNRVWYPHLLVEIAEQNF